MEQSKSILINKLLLVFIMIQPIFDLSFFYGQIATLIRLIFILVLFVIVFLMDKSTIKKWLIGYLGIVILYFMFHHLNTLDFKSLGNNDFNYSVLAEGLYFLKMLMSVFLIYIIYTTKLSLKQINKPINIAVLLISGSIVILNFLSLGYSAYSFEIISGNFFTWFLDHNLLFDDLASKGYFEFANQIVAILILYLPLIVYFFFKEFKPLNIFTLFIMLLSLLMLGTRISVYGSLLVLIFIMIIYFLMVILKKEKFKVIPVIVIVLFGLLFSVMINYSPVKLKQNFYEEVYEQDTNITNSENIENEITNNVDNETEKLDKLTYILNNYEDKRIFEEFILYSYPYQNDPDFWLKIMEEDVTKRVDTRYLEIEMVKRVVEINDNKLDSLLGITYSRIMGIFNIERDYIMQYYSLGIIGMFLLLGPYFLVIIISIINILKDFKNKFNFKNLILLSSVCIMLFSAYFSGNILNGAGCIIPLAFTCGVLLKEISYVKMK